MRGGSDIYNEILIPKTIAINRKEKYSIDYYNQNGILEYNTKDIEDIENEPVKYIIVENLSDSNFVTMYDNRKFYTKISRVNFEYILANVETSRGICIEDELIYGWYNNQLILIPTSNSYYKNSLKFTEKIFNKSFVKWENLKPSKIYTDTKLKKYMFLAKSNYYVDGDEEKCEKEKRFWFYDVENKNIISVKSDDKIDFLSEKINQDVKMYSTVLDLLEHKCEYSPIDNSKTLYLKYNLAQVKINIHNLEFHEEIGYCGRNECDCCKLTINCTPRITETSKILCNIANNISDDSQFSYNLIPDYAYIIKLYKSDCTEVKIKLQSIGYNRISIKFFENNIWKSDRSILTKFDYIMDEIYRIFYRGNYYYKKIYLKNGNLFENTKYDIKKENYYD